MPTETVTDLIARQEWAEPIEEGLQKAVAGAFAAGGAAGQQTEDFLHGTWLGHPLHPVLTDVPLGAWTVAAVLDIADARSPSRANAAAADAALAIGLIGAAGAAVTGLTDWHKTDGRPRRIGLIHGLLNLSATTLCATSWILRRRKARNAARVCSWLGYAVSAGAAYLGGYLVYSEKIGTDHADRKAIPAAFVPVLPVAELAENELRRVEVSGVRALLVRRGEHIYALAETCAHLGGPLAEGHLTDGSVVCPWHGSRFALEDGRVLDGPSTYSQPCFEARIRDGQIEVRMPPPSSEAANASLAAPPVEASA
jgi:nitrite reductase/ring-hydroxylating ferredoxin subunit/uncharacterized membrane protein